MKPTLRKFTARTERGALAGTLEIPPSDTAPYVATDQHGTLWLLRGYASENTDQYGNLCYYLRVRATAAQLQPRKRKRRRRT